MNAVVYIQLIVFIPQKSGRDDAGTEKKDFRVVVPSSTFEVSVIFRRLWFLNRHKKDMSLKSSYKNGTRVPLSTSRIG